MPGGLGGLYERQCDPSGRSYKSRWETSLPSLVAPTVIFRGIFVHALVGLISLLVQDRLSWTRPKRTISILSFRSVSLPTGNIQKATAICTRRARGSSRKCCCRTLKGPLGRLSWRPGLRPPVRGLRSTFKRRCAACGAKGPLRARGLAVRFSRSRRYGTRRVANARMHGVGSGMCPYQ
jgi:hypothetical protein